MQHIATRTCDRHHFPPAPFGADRRHRKMVRASRSIVDFSESLCGTQCTCQTRATDAIGGLPTSL